MIKKGIEKEQISILVPVLWKEKLEQIAREKAFNENKKYNYLDLIRDTLNESLNLDDI